MSDYVFTEQGEVMRVELIRFANGEMAINIRNTAIGTQVKISPGEMDNTQFGKLAEIILKRAEEAYSKGRLTAKNKTDN